MGITSNKVTQQATSQNMRRNVEYIGSDIDSIGLEHYLSSEDYLNSITEQAIPLLSSSHRKGRERKH